MLECPSNKSWSGDPAFEFFALVWQNLSLLDLAHLFNSSPFWCSIISLSITKTNTCCRLGSVWSSNIWALNFGQCKTHWQQSPRWEVSHCWAGSSSTLRRMATGRVLCVPASTGTHGQLVGDCQLWGGGISTNLCKGRFARLGFHAQGKMRYAGNVGAGLQTRRCRPFCCAWSASGR